MNLAQRPHSRRGFTLIEMLVVIAIITVLVALVVPAVMYFTRKGPQLLTTNEISQLDTAIQNFKTTYKVDYIPSRLFLAENLGDYNRPNDVLAQDSLAFGEEPLLEGVCDLLELWRRQVGEHCEARNAVCDLVLAGHRRAMSSAIPTARGLCATTFGRRRIIV